MPDANDTLLRDSLKPLAVKRGYHAINTPEGETLKYRGITCFEEVIVCPKCEYDLPNAARRDRWKFCPVCGQAIVLK